MLLRNLPLLTLALASIACSRPSTPSACLPRVPSLPAPSTVDCRSALGPRIPPETLATLRRLPRCLSPTGSPMSSAELCWTAGEASIVGSVLARLLLEDDRVRACLDAEVR